MNLRQLVRDVIAELDHDQQVDEPPLDHAAARRFLKNLDPGSQEGLWFEALAEGYPSRVDAALAYLREVKRNRT